MKEWTREELAAFLETKASGLIYFYTPFCGTCQVSSKMLQVTEKIVTVELGKMNLNYFPDLAEKFAVESVPCLLFIQNGQIIESLYAFRSVPYLLEKINEYVI
jgi:thioredoxin-like negative regulator of GroEL